MPSSAAAHPALHSFPTRRSSDLPDGPCAGAHGCRAERRRYARPHARSGWGVRTVAPEMTGERGPERIRLVGGSITALSFQEHLELLVTWARVRESRVVCVANVHMMVEARRNPEFGAVLARADVATPDGMPLVWLMRHGGAPGQERVAGMDLLPALCRRAAEDRIGVFFLGSTPEILSAIRRRLESEPSGSVIAGMEAPP